VGEVHGGHAAMPELPLDGVAAGEGGLEQLSEIGPQRCLLGWEQWGQLISFLNLGCWRSGSNAGSIRSHPGER
jgi:hypothetical protein